MTNQNDLDEAIAENKLMALRMIPVILMALVLGAASAGMAYAAGGKGGAISAGITTAAGYIYGNLSPTGKFTPTTEGLKDLPKP